MVAVASKIQQLKCVKGSFFSGNLNAHAPDGLINISGDGSSLTIAQIRDIYSGLMDGTLEISQGSSLEDAATFLTTKFLSKTRPDAIAPGKKDSIADGVMRLTKD